MASTKQLVGSIDHDGWGNYRTTTSVRAVQMEKPFALRRIGTDDIAVGKAGDWLVDTEKRQYIIDQDIFKQTYEAVEEE